MHAGIDYGLGQTNIDLKTGIRYGVISQGSICQAWADTAEPDYGKATCPKCGNEAQDFGDYEGDVDAFTRSHGCDDYLCEPCQYVFDSSEAFGDEPSGWSVDDGEYKMIDCLDSDVMVLESPYYTFAEYCSPCVPGAGNLNSTGPHGVKTYCLDHDWFDDGKAPYPVYSVETGQEIKPWSHPGIQSEAR